MRYRVFGSTDVAVEPAAFLEFLHGAGLEVQARFRGDDQGWFWAEVHLSGENEPITLERFLSSEEGIRSELNTWAAWLESVPGNGHQERLMRDMIGARQVFTLSHEPDSEPDATLRECCLAMCRYLAGATDGVYQVDGAGFFAATGALLVPED